MFEKAVPPVETLYAGACELGEGPSYDPDRHTAWWFDIVGCKLFEHSFETGKTAIHTLPRMASMLARIDGERRLVAMEDGLYIRTAFDGDLRLICPLEADNPATRSNDGRAHPSGALWVGTMGKNKQKRAGAIYWFFKGELKTLFQNITIPNAICFSPDGKSGYFADTAEGLLFRVELDPLTGLPVGGPAIFFDNRSRKGGLDGAVVDRDGVLWNARWGAGMVDAYSPQGQRIRSVALPASQVTCPAFCGRRGERLLVTSAWEGMGEEARGAEPAAGHTFIIQSGFKGCFEPDIQL